MNEKQIAFIICANNAQFYNECVWYIEKLVVPEGYSTDILCIQEAESMAEGYNAGMKASDAKYKVYLHQDTFILNENFIEDILGIFESDSEIGMLGVLGADKCPENANCYLSWNIGSALAYNGMNTVDIRMETTEEKYTCVDAVDGLLIATQYDVEWREDILTGWDFYDVSQSLEMKRKGYKVVVPKQEKTWCYHDCGASKLGQYDKYREVVAREYPEVFCIEYVKPVNNDEKAAEVVALREKMISILNAGLYEQLSDILPELRAEQLRDTQLRELYNVMEIYWLEKENSVQHSEFFDGRAWIDIYEYYKWIAFTVRRIAQGYIDEDATLLKEKVNAKEVSLSAVQRIMTNSMKECSAVEDYLFGNKIKPLISVILPVYNGEKFVAETIESILNQTYENLEVIIIDDGSADGSREVISSYQDARIKAVFLPRNCNVCYAANTALQMATGEYIALTGHDDLWTEDKIAKQFAFMEANRAFHACFSWMDIIDEEGKIRNEKYPELAQRFMSNNCSREKWLKKLLSGGNYFCAPSAFIRGKVLRQVGYYHYGLLQLQDFDLWLRFLREGNFFIFKDKLVKYRRFNKEGQNLSSVSPKTIIRDFHERQWIIDTNIWKMPSEEFIHIFREELKNPNAKSEKEVLCEKAFLLWEYQNCFSVGRFMEILDDEECRDILEKNYQFRLQDFYDLNAKSMLFDPNPVFRIRELERELEESKKV
ncbi:MAG: glycosyltransferase [Lachnospiraceae bacterium]|nr:glycosyltransferase [Lachnospiraceae bacterium]